MWYFIGSLQREKESWKSNIGKVKIEGKEFSTLDFFNIDTTVYFIGEDNFRPQLGTYIYSFSDCDTISQSRTTEFFNFIHFWQE